MYRWTRFVVSVGFCSSSGLLGCSVLLPSNNIEPPQPALAAHLVRVNSVGYVADRVKLVTVVLPTGTSSLATATAELRDVASGTVAATFELTGPTADAPTGTTIYLGDFSSFTTPGEYYVSVPALPDGDLPAQSARFRIAADVFRDTLERAVLAMYGQRCGQAVSITRDDVRWSHAACHLEDAYLDYLTGETKKQASVGGWHDAGDYGKYVTNAAFSVGTMLAAWEHFQPQLAALSLPALPEHGGALPDYLDEVKFELDWLLTTQRDDGGVVHKLTALDFEGDVMPEAAVARRYFTPVGTAATADFVAVMAEAARVYAPLDMTLAASYLAAARRGYTFLAANAGPPVPDTKDTFKTGGYGQRTDDQNRLWAAAELWQTTGEAPFLADLEARIDVEVPAGKSEVDDSFDWGNPTNLGRFTYLLSAREGRNPTLVARLRAAAIAAADRLTDNARASGFGRGLTGYWWGSNGAVARAAMNLWVAHRLVPDPKYLDAIAMQLDHLLGRNFYDRSQVTGVGYNPPRQPHHRPSMAGGRNKPPWPGLLVGGSDSSATTWRDDFSAYSLNEVAINWNAAFIYATAALTPAP